MLEKRGSKKGPVVDLKTTWGLEGVKKNMKKMEITWKPRDQRSELKGERW